MDVKSFMKKRDDHTASNHQGESKRSKMDSHQAAEDGTAVTNSQGSQHGQYNEELNASPSSPPDADKTLGDLFVYDWLKDGITEQEEENLQFQLNASIALLKRNPEFRRGVQKFLKIDLDHFLTTGEVSPILSTTELQRVAVIDYEIESSTLSYKRDFNAFKNRVESLFAWRTNAASGKDTYMAPYFPLIQSSGTGKTKLMFEYKQEMLGNDNIHCALILCHDGNRTSMTGKKESIFTDYLDVSKFSANDDGRAQLVKVLNDLIEKTKKKVKKVVLLFDESQHLIRTSDGWHFRVIRWWLRRPDHKISVVCVFAGTNTSLANYYDEPMKQSTSSRDAGIHYNEGNKLYPPFYEITTTGLVARTNGSQVGCINGNLSEFDVAVLYGRPLFARMHLKGELKCSLGQILLRMKGGVRDRSNDAVSLQQDFAVLATRLQLGQVPFDFASRLVASGYAHLTYFAPARTAVAEIAYLPDPVCAWLAMTQMIEGCDIIQNVGGFEILSGQRPSVWSEKAIKIYSSALCRPEKGDVGEVAAAFYMLACGDKLRREQCQDLKKLSVPLEKWIATLQGKSGDDSLDIGSGKEGASVNFIQVCRNYLRHSLKDFQSSQLLKHWYLGARASYAYACCPAYDLLVPIQYTTENEYHYCPMLVSVKNRLSYSVTERDASVDAMKNAFKNAGVQTGVCILLLIGLEAAQPTVDDQPCFEFAAGQISTVVIEVPNDDPFGATNLAWCSTSGGGEKSEVMASHAELAFGPQIDFQRLLRSKTAKSAPSAVFLNDILKCIKDEQRGNFVNNSNQNEN